MDNILRYLSDNNIHIWVENGGVKFSCKKSNLTNECIALLCENEEKLLSYLTNNDNIKRKAVATQNQMALWIERKMGNVGGDIHNGILKKYDGKLNIDNVKKAFIRVLNKYDALTCTFTEENGVVYIENNQIDERFFWYYEKEEEYAKDFMENIMRETMDLKNGPLFKVAICKCGEDKYYMGFWCHHIISDAYSLFLIEKDFYLFYDQIENNNKRYNEVEKLSSYIEIVEKEAEYLESDDYNNELEFWKENINPAISGTTLPRFNITNNAKEYKSKTYIHRISKDVSLKINDIAKKQKLTPYILLFAIFNLGIHFVNEKTENSIGLFAANRMDEKNLKEVGYFSNAIVFQDDFCEDDLLVDYLKKVKINLIKLLDNQHMPFTRLVQELTPTRECGMPFFNIAFDSLLFQKDNEKLKLQELLGFKDCSLLKGSGDYDLIVWVSENNGCYELEYRYNKVYYEDYQISSFASVMDGIMSCIGNNEQKLCDIPVLYGEYKDVIDKQNNTYVDIKEYNVLNMFCKEQEKRLNKVAIRFQDKKLTYQEMMEVITSVCYKLEKENISKGSYVGIMMKKNEYLIPIILGVWAAGGVYVPIDPNFPVNRQEYIIKNTKLAAIIKDNTEWNIKCDVKSIQLEEILREDKRKKIQLIDLQPNDPAYVLYTSGSTGNPKGVVISHESLTNFLLDMKTRVQLKESDTVLVVTSICFDISILEMFLPMVSGADVVLMSYESSKSGKEILKTIKDYNITFMQATPSSYEILYEHYKESGEKSTILETSLCGGESYELDLVEKIQEMSINVYNVYGPTETTIWSTVYKIPPNCMKLKIGQPIANTMICIADNRGKELPVGVPGELLIGGKGVFLGYFNELELTKEVMIKTKNNKRFYKTGDWAYWNQNGELIFLGRRDSQIKIRGFRIEIAEIENVFRKCENILNVSVVTTKINNVDILIAAVVLKDNKISTKAEIYDCINKSLPEYMIPNDIIFLKELPKTNNNKIDKKAIIQQVLDKLTESEEKQSRAESEQEIKLNDIWNEILKTNVRSIDKGFFEVGGDSLLLNKLTLRLQKEYEKDIDIIDLLKYNTIRKMSLYLSDNAIDVKLDDDKLKSAANRRKNLIRKRKM